MCASVFQTPIDRRCGGILSLPVQVSLGQVKLTCWSYSQWPISPDGIELGQAVDSFHPYRATKRRHYLANTPFQGRDARLRSRTRWQHGLQIR